MTFAPGDLGHFQPQLLVGARTRGVQHRVPAQGFLLQPVSEDCGHHKIGDGEAGRLLEAPDVPLPRLDVVLGVPLEPAVQDAQQHAGEAAPGLRPPLLLEAAPCRQALTLAGRLHLVQRPVLRQERQHVIELDAEGLLGGDSAAVAAAGAATVAMFAAVPIDAAATQAAVVAVVAVVAVCCCCCCCSTCCHCCSCCCCSQWPCSSQCS